MPTETNVVLPDEQTEQRQVTQTKSIDFEAKEINGEKLEKNSGNPFCKARNLKKRMKMFLFGASGTLKTRTALFFADAVIDTESGTDLYGSEFDFFVLKTSDPDELMNTVKWLLTNKHNYKTLVIDSFTVYWDALQDKWINIFMKRNKRSAGFKFDYYDLQPGDWKKIKGEFKLLIRRLLMLDMNVIVTAREKSLYKGGKDNFMEIIGETYDAEKGLSYEFDAVVRLYKEKNMFMAECLKDRTGKFPKLSFKYDIEIFREAIGRDNLTRLSTPLKMITKTQKRKIENYLKQINASESDIRMALAHHNAESLDDLTKEKADYIIETLERTV